MDGTDAWLVARIAAGDDLALGEVYDETAKVVFVVAVRILGDAAAAEDVVQDVFVQLWSHPERYDPAAAPLRTYLLVLARHRALDVWRAETRRTARQERHHRLTPKDADPLPAEEVETAELSRLVQDAVRRLPGDQRRLVELAYFAGMSYREVAAAEGIPEGTAKSRMRAALAKLQVLLDRQLLEST